MTEELERTTPGRPADDDDGGEGKPTFRPYHHPAAGWGAARSVAEFVVREREPVAGTRAILRMNEDGGFDWTDMARRSRTDPEAREVLRRWRRKLAIVNRSAEKLRVLEDIFRLHPDESCVVFTASNRMALDVSARFLVPAITSHSDKHERNAVLDAFASVAGPVEVADPELEQLTAREREVLRHIARGYLYKEIAARLNISTKTVEAHVSAVLRKLQLSSRHELSRWAVQRRLVD